jgi:o-succinylbenzoate---CoA ligase
VKLAGFGICRYGLPYGLPLSEPLRLKGKELRHREGLLVELASGGGAVGWGEAAPLPGFSREGLDEVIWQLRGLASSMMGRGVTEDILDPEGAFARELDATGLAPSARFGFELALLDLWAVSSGKALPELLTPRPRASVPVNALISSPDYALGETRRARAAGYEAVKLKVGARSVEEDVELVRSVRWALGDAASLRLDANRAWSPEEAERFARGTADLGFEYVEEPLADPTRLPFLAGSHGLPVALDESLADVEPEALEDYGYARAVVLKPTLLGGISRTLRFARRASRLGVQSVISSAYETDVGMSALVALAAGVGDGEVPAGLDTYRRLAGEVLEPRLELPAPRVDVRALFGERREIERRLLRPVGYHGLMDDATRIPCPLRAAARRSPDAPAIVGVDGSLTYRELDARVSAAAGRARELGFGAGDRLALHLPKGERYLVLLLALIRTRAVACLLSTRLPPRGAAPLLERVACRALVSSSEELLEAASVQRVRPEDLLSDGPAERDRPQPAEKVWLVPDLPATIVFTSGSTAAPKAALHTFGNHFFSAEGSNANIALAPGDRWLYSLPPYHVGGLSILFRCLLAGATVVLPEPGAPLGDAIGGTTHVSLVSTQLLRLLREKDFERGGLKALLLGGGQIPVSLVDEAAARGLPIHTSYGLTEMASQVTTTPPGASLEELRTSGRLLPHREVALSGDGEILVKGKTLFAGYVKGDIIDRPLDADSWFHTGDLGELDESGYLRVRGRKDNLFVSGGENIQPEEVEEVLSGLEGVEEAVVVPVPDPEFGLRPVAFVRTAGGFTKPETLERALGPVLPRFKIPVAFHGWPEQVGPGGMKVDRTFLRERARRLHPERRS